MAIILLNFNLNDVETGEWSSLSDLLVAWGKLNFHGFRMSEGFRSCGSFAPELALVHFGLKGMRLCK